MSWKPVFQLEGHGAEWISNAMRFATKAEALEDAFIVMHGWPMTVAFDAWESADPVNYKREHGKTVPVGPP